MDKYLSTVDTFNKHADQYQQKFMAYDAYVETYEAFYQLFKQGSTKILDVACGPGNIAKYLLSRDPTLTIHGVDLAPRMIELAKINCPTATFEILDSRDIGQIAKRFDAIIAGFCFPYLTKHDVALFLQHASELLKPGGLLYLSTMEGSDERSGFDQSSSGDGVYTHYHQFDFISQHLETNKFEIVDTIRKTFPAKQDESTVDLPTTDLFIFARAL